MTLPLVVFTLLEDETPGAALDRLSSTVLPGMDWALDSDGDLIIPMRFTTGPEAVAQGIVIRIKTFFGEWFADLQFGLDWYGKILGQKFNDIRIRDAFRVQILASPGVVSIERLVASYEGATRKLTVDWDVVSDYGLISGSVEV